MSRTRTIPDSAIFLLIRQLLAQGGEKAVSFASVARSSGLAAPSLVQRYRSREAMLRDALMAAWDALMASTATAIATAEPGPKGATALLKTLGGEPGDVADIALLAVDFRDAKLRQRAVEWRAVIEGALAARLGGGAKGRAAAGLLFAAWQGQMLWQVAGGKAFKLKDAVARLT